MAMCCVQSERVFPASDSDEEVCGHELPLESQWAEACCQYSQPYGPATSTASRLSRQQRQQRQSRQSSAAGHGHARRSFSSSVVADLRAVEQDCILVSGACSVRYLASRSIVSSVVVVGCHAYC